MYMVLIRSSVFHVPVVKALVHASSQHLKVRLAHLFPDLQQIAIMEKLSVLDVFSGIMEVHRLRVLLKNYQDGAAQVKMVILGFLKLVMLFARHKIYYPFVVILFALFFLNYCNTYNRLSIYSRTASLINSQEINE